MRIALALVMVAVLSSVARADGALVVLVDRTMSADKIATVTHALTENLDTFGTSDQIAIVSYAKTARVDLALQSIKHRDRISRAVARITTAAESNLDAGLRTAIDILAPTKHRRFVLVVTDSDSAMPSAATMREVSKQRIQISALGYQSSNGHRLSSIASNGGRAYPIKRASDLTRVFARAATDRPPPPTLAVVFVIDRSWSMDGPKLDVAKEVTRAGVEALAPESVVAVVTFDTAAQVFVQPQRANAPTRISAEVSRLTRGGGSNVYAGLKEAHGLLTAINADQKMVILVGDGDAAMDGVPGLLQDMRASEISVSAVGVPGADRTVLSMIADGGDGRLFTAEDLGSLPRIFMRTSEL